MIAEWRRGQEDKRRERRVEKGNEAVSVSVIASDPLTATGIDIMQSNTDGK